MLSDAEQLVLETLAQRGKASAGRLAQIVDLKRPTVYAILDRLSEMGLVTKNISGKKSLFSPLPASTISKVLQHQAQREYLLKQHDIDALATRLSVRQEGVSYELSGYEITALESPDAIRIQLEEILVKGYYKAIFNPQVVLQGDTKALVERFLQASSKLAPPIHELCVDGPMCDWYRAHIRNPNHEVRLLPASSDIQSDIIFSDGQVVICYYKHPRQLAIKIVQEEFYRSSLAQFELMWSGAKAPTGPNSVARRGKP